MAFSTHLFTAGLENFAEVALRYILIHVSCVAWNDDKRSLKSQQTSAKSAALQVLKHFIMVALCNRADHYIFMLWFVLLSFFFFFPRLISAAADWMSAILPHIVWP